MTSIAVVNESTLITNEQCKVMAEACNIQFRNHLAPAWGTTPYEVAFVSNSSLTKDMYPIIIFDDPDQPDALGYHEEVNGRPDGKVFARPSMDHGSSVYTGDYSVSSILSHEVLELVIDPTTTQWSLAAVDRNNNATFVAKEICDAVESQFYTVSVRGTKVNVSNFVLPSWFDPQTKSRYTDVLKLVNKPLVLAKGGYVQLWDRNGINAVYGDQMPSWRREMKMRYGSRGLKRHLAPIGAQQFE